MKITLEIQFRLTYMKELLNKLYFLTINFEELL